MSLQEAMARGSTLRPYDLPINIKMRRILGEYIRRNYQNKFYAKSQNLVPVLTHAYDEALKDVVVLVMPTVSELPGRLPTLNSTAKGRPNGTGVSEQIYIRIRISEYVCV